jgi:hypothetical protein
MYDFAFVLGLADEECCPIVLKFFHSHIYIKNKDISSPECNIWDYYPQILAPMSASGTLIGPGTHPGKAVCHVL